MNQTIDSNLGKMQKNIARPEYSARGPDNPPLEFFPKKVVVRQ
jgi:hypothetical protein